MSYWALALLPAALLASGAACAASSKQGRSYYTAERLAAMRENLDRHDWARQGRDKTLAAADAWLKIPDAELQLMVPPPDLPRDAYVHDQGCPVHGQAIQKFGTYSWKVSLEHPFKVQCPVGGEFYPDNDFDAYYRSGVADGRFDPKKADRSLLKGDVVDDGWGWEKPGDPRKYRYWFVAYYAHWMLIDKVVIGVLRDCSQAYLLTGDGRYAHKAALVLWQLARFYPDYQYEKQSRYGVEIDHGYKGKLRYHTWECFTVQQVADAYDAIFPALAGDAELSKLTRQSGADIAEYVESRMLREMARLIMDGSHTIAGNYGMHQEGLLRLALVCGDEAHAPKRSAMVDWVLNNDQVGIYTDFSVYDALYNVVFRDGVPFESPGYNLGWLNNLMPLARALKECGVDLFTNPRFRSLYDFPLNMSIGGRFSPALGDSGNLYHGAIGLSRALYAPAWDAWRDPRYARLCADAGGAGADLFARSREEEIQAAAGTAPERGTESFLFPAYGMSLLQTGGGPDGRTAAMLYQGAARTAHAHFDNLHLDLYAKNHVLLPDFGYPETANSQDPRRFGFISHTVAHNTVMVNARRSEPAFADVSAWDTGDFVQVVEAHAEGCYPGVVSRYRRTVALVDVSPTDAYVVDLFRVKGGEQHDWVVHGSDADFAAAFPLTPPRAEGTLAGADVPYEHFYDDERMAKAPLGSVSYVPYRGSGFMYLYNVQEGELNAPATASWLPRRRPPGTPDGKMVLRAHLLAEGERAYVCDGKPQQNNRVHPESVKFLLRRRSGQDVESTFATVFEPYLNEPILRSVRRLHAEPADPGLVALRIERADGGVDYFLSATDPGKPYRVEGGLRFQGEAGVLRLDAAGKVTAAHATNASLLELGDFRLAGEPTRQVPIAAVDYEKGVVALAEPCLRGAAMEGRWVVVANAEHASAYRVAKVLDARRFSLGDQDPRCGRLLPTAWDPAAGVLATSGYSYAARPGMRVVDEAGQVLGKIEQAQGSKLTLRAPRLFALADLPDADGDGRRRVWVMDFAPGDTVKLCTSMRFAAR